MMARRIGSALRICAAAVLVFSAFSGSAAQPASTTTGPAVAVDRHAVVMEILNSWSDYRIPVDSENNSPYGPYDLRLALKNATLEQLQDARNAKTFDDLVAALPRNAGSGVTLRALAAGERIPQVIGSTSGDLVFTPVTPCRIVDTRFQSVPARIGPDAGVYYYVTGTTYAAQGGVATSCGIPTSPKPSAISINVATTNQSSTGSVRVIATGAGNPNVSLMNYSPIQNLSNAAVVASYTGSGQEIYVYSASAATDVVIDIMGYFTSPAVTPVDNEIMIGSLSVAASATFDIFSAPCDAGYRLVSGGFRSSAYAGIANIAASRPALGTSTSVITGANAGDRWLCQGQGAAFTNTVECYAVCARIPGH
jgi:hypothetical protein